MPSQGASATPSLGAQDARLKTALELGSVKFHIKTGNTKWQCTVMDRATQYVHTLSPDTETCRAALLMHIAVRDRRPCVKDRRPPSQRMHLLQAPAPTKRRYLKTLHAFSNIPSHRDFVQRVLSFISSLTRVTAQPEFFFGLDLVLGWVQRYSERARRSLERTIDDGKPLF